MKGGFLLYGAYVMCEGTATVGMWPLKKPQINVEHLFGFAPMLYTIAFSVYFILKRLSYIILATILIWKE